MRKIIFGMALLMLAPVLVCGAAKDKQREAIRLEIVSIKTGIHGSGARNVFSYSSALFAKVSGQNVVYVCDQSGDACPVLESGRSYTAERAGDAMYIAIASKDGKHPLVARFRASGSW